jgi:tetratricopeptide (TPR) repeat protein
MKTAVILPLTFIVGLACVVMTTAASGNDDFKTCSEPVDRDPDKGIAGCDALIENKKNDVPTIAFAYMHRGKWRSDKKEWTEAYKDLDQAIKLQRSLALYLTKAEVQSAQGDDVAAIATYGEALARLPRGTQYPQVHSGRGDALLRAGQKERAIADFKRFYEIYPNDLRAWKKLKALGVDAGPAPPPPPVTGQGYEDWGEDD